MITDWGILPALIVADYVPVEIDKFMELLVDFRKTELARLRKQKKLSSRFLEDIDQRMLECARKLCEKE